MFISLIPASPSLWKYSLNYYSTILFCLLCDQCLYSQLMVIPSSTPGFFGSFTWNVPELGMTDSDRDEQTVSAECKNWQILILYLDRLEKSLSATRGSHHIVTSPHFSCYLCSSCCLQWLICSTFLFLGVGAYLLSIKTMSDKLQGDRTRLDRQWVRQQIFVLFSSEKLWIWMNLNINCLS